MFVLALTGGVACGKSTVCRSLIRILEKTTGVAHFNCDASVGELLTEPEILGRLSGVAGDQVLDSDGELNRSWLRDAVFQRPGLRREVEGVLHPEVLKRAAAFFRESERDRSLVIIEVPLLYEVDFPVDRDMVVVVGASGRTQIQRITEKRNLDQDTARRIIDAQVSVQEKVDKGDWVIWNDGARSALQLQIDCVAERLKNFI